MDSSNILHQTTLLASIRPGLEPSMGVSTKTERHTRTCRFHLKSLDRCVRKSWAHHDPQCLLVLLLPPLQIVQHCTNVSHQCLSFHQVYWNYCWKDALHDCAYYLQLRWNCVKQVKTNMYPYVVCVRTCGCGVYEKVRLACLVWSFCWRQVRKKCRHQHG